MNSITQFGAKPGGDILATPAIQNAIDRTAEQGGGTVLVPGGVWLTGGLRLRSRVWLELSPGAVLLGSPDARHYPVMRPRYRSFHDAGGFRALIYAESEENIGLCGSGLIDAQGEKFSFQKDEHDTRPRGLQFVSCRDVTVRDLRLRNSAMWMQHYLDCERVQIRGLRVWNHSNHNNDMLDIDGCRWVIVSDCMGDTDDDGITLKSTGSAPCEDIVISNCIVSSRCNAFKCGSESTGGFRNVSISNCVVRPSSTKSGIYGYCEGISAVSLEIVDGGTMEGVCVSGLTIEGTRSPLFIRLGDRGRRHHADAPHPAIGALRRIYLRDIVARSAGAVGSSITAVPGGCIEDVELSRFHVQNAVAPSADYCPSLPEEKIGEYPEATMFGLLPAHGLFVRRAKNVRLDDARFAPAHGDPRPALAVHEVNNLSSGTLQMARL